MNLLLIASGYPPYTFSENICNGKLVLTLHRTGYHVDTICSKDEGSVYSTTWMEPWIELKKNTHEIRYPTSGRFGQVADVLRACISLGTLPINGIRWARRALEEALNLHKQRPFDAILTRSPSDIPHLVGRSFTRRTGVKWLANWNDPAMTIWPGCYTHHISPIHARMYDHLLSSCMAEATINTFPSQQLMEHFQEHFPTLKQNQCYVVPHCNLPEECFPTKEYQRNSEFRMCHAGNMSGERNPELLFAAMRRIMEETGQLILLDIIGVTNPHVEKLVKDYDLSNCVHFIGTLSYMETLKIMQKYDILVLLEAKLEKGIFFASKITDYAQSRRPILAVSPERGFAANMFERFGGGLSVNNECVDSIANGLQRMLDSWRHNTLETDFSMGLLTQQFSTESINKIYKNLLNL